MNRHIFNTLSLISAILLACTIISWPWSYRTDPREDRLSIGDSFHMGAYNGRVSFFNVKEYGPYRGSTIGSEPDERREFGDTLGIYYRYFRWADSGAVLWTLSVSLVYPMIVFLMLPIAWIWKGRQRIATICRALRETDNPQLGMFVAIRLYWWIGILGAAAYLVIAACLYLDRDFRAEFPSPATVAAMLTCCLALVAFATSIHVAHRLKTKPAGMLPYARMVGIALATAWFPILTIPGIICVRRVTKHFATYCESVAGNHSKGTL